MEAAGRLVLYVVWLCLDAVVRLPGFKLFLLDPVFRPDPAAVVAVDALEVVVVTAVAGATETAAAAVGIAAEAVVLIFPSIILGRRFCVPGDDSSSAGVFRLEQDVEGAAVVFGCEVGCEVLLLVLTRWTSFFFFSAPSASVLFS